MNGISRGDTFSPFLELGRSLLFQNFDIRRLKPAPPGLPAGLGSIRNFWAGGSVGHRGPGCLSAFRLPGSGRCVYPLVRDAREKALRSSR